LSAGANSWSQTLGHELFVRDLVAAYHSISSKKYRIYIALNVFETTLLQKESQKYLSSIEFFEISTNTWISLRKALPRLYPLARAGV
jgi:hypothetical protein